MTVNRQVILAERPRYIIPTSKCFKMKEGRVPSIGEGEVLVQTTWLSLDPYLHSRMKRTSEQAEPVKLGAVMVGLAAGRVVESKHSGFQPGEIVYGLWDAWQEFASPDPAKLRKLDPRIQQPSHVLGALNVAGFASYLALYDIAAAKACETVVIGTATGSFGQIAGQIAKNLGCRVVGIVGHQEKCALATEKLGYDACLNYRDKRFSKKLSEACPDGVDIYLDTIGGKVTDALLPRLNLHARMVICGMMSLLDSSASRKKAVPSDVWLKEIINRRLTIRGLVSMDSFKDRFGAFQEDMIDWLDSGAIKPLEDVVDGLENAPAALQGMFSGKNMGKLVVKVAD